ARSGSLHEGTGASASPGSAVSAEVLRPSPAPPPLPHASSVYHVQAGDKVRDYEEAELAEAIRKGKLTGLELSRRDQEEVWQPLCESHVYRREVPSAGDPRDAARWRVIRRLIGHFAGFFITGVVMMATQGHLPGWMAIWGAVIFVQVLRTTPV